MAYPESETTEEMAARVRKELDDRLTQWQRESEVRCPHCDHLAPQDEGQFRSMWAEDGPEETTCEHCEKTFWVQEYVRRTYATAKTKEGLEE
jgi:hypothetical protein